MEEEERVQRIKDCILEKKGEDIVVYDVRDRSPICSYIIIATVSNPRHGGSVADALEELLGRMEAPLRHREGKETDHWQLLDADDIVIHLFTKEERAKFRLEELLETPEKWTKNDQ